VKEKERRVTRRFCWRNFLDLPTFKFTQPPIRCLLSSTPRHAMPTFSELRARAVSTSLHPHIPLPLISSLTLASRKALQLLPKTNLNPIRNHLLRPSTLQQDRNLLLPLLFANLLHSLRPTLPRLLPHKLSDLLQLEQRQQRQTAHRLEQSLHLLTKREPLKQREVHLAFLPHSLLAPPRQPLHRTLSKSRSHSVSMMRTINKPCLQSLTSYVSRFSRFATILFTYLFS